MEYTFVSNVHTIDGTHIYMVLAVNILINLDILASVMFLNYRNTGLFISP